MESMPRLPMLSFELKHSPDYVEFGPKLKEYIKNHYGEDPALYNKACTDLEQLRQTAVQVTRDYMGCTTLKKYYAQLQYLQGRFPMTDEGEASIAFTWEDVQTGREHTINDIKFEQACILYNIGSLHSLLGVLDTRHNAEGMKVSCTHFQCAAWAFEHLRNEFATASMSTDMSYELLSFHIMLMLAQAQECILEKSMIDGRKNNITAKVAAQVVEFYKDTIKAIDVAQSKQQINSRMHKDWSRRLEMKTSFYQCITYYYLGKQAEESEKPGECLAYFTAAKDELAKATQLAKNDFPEVDDCMTYSRDVVVGKYESAKKDNELVYHEKVPSLDTLPEIKGASLVKGIPFNPTDKDISGPDIFQKLVPMEAHEASSVYSEEKAKLSRTVVEDIESKNLDLEQFLSSLQLDTDQLMPQADLIPENLMEKCAAMSVRTNAIKELTDAMASVSGLATEVELGINELQEILAQDTEKTAEFETQFGKRTPSTVLPGIQNSVSEYINRHQEGSTLNTALHKAMNTHTSNLKVLSMAPAEIQAYLPPSQPTLTPEDEATLSQVRRLMQKVSEMKEQRKALLDKFRSQLHSDDITNVLVTQETVDKEHVFAEQLSKHDQTVDLINKNLAAQDNILRALTDANAQFAVIRQAYGEAKSKREKVIQELIVSYEKYEELLGKAQKGCDYYQKLQENVNKSVERCASECKVRQEERDMIVEKYAPKVPPPSRPSAPKPGTSGNATGTTSFGGNFESNPAYATADITGFPGATSIPPLPSSQFPTAIPPSFEGPKLKDYLPFMKPRSFGPKGQAGGGNTPDSVPPVTPSVPPESPVPDTNTINKFPGLDPNLASVLPATIAQYLASVSGSATSVGGGQMPGMRHSPSPSPSPVPSLRPTPPQSPAVYSASTAYSQHPHIPGHRPSPPLHDPNLSHHSMMNTHSGRNGPASNTFPNLPTSESSLSSSQLYSLQQQAQSAPQISYGQMHSQHHQEQQYLHHQQPYSVPQANQHHQMPQGNQQLQNFQHQQSERQQPGQHYTSNPSQTPQSQQLQPYQTNTVSSFQNPVLSSGREPGNAVFSSQLPQHAATQQFQPYQGPQQTGQATKQYQSTGNSQAGSVQHQTWQHSQNNQQLPPNIQGQMYNNSNQGQSQSPVPVAGQQAASVQGQFTANLPQQNQSQGLPPHVHAGTGQVPPHHHHPQGQTQQYSLTGQNQNFMQAQNTTGTQQSAGIPVHPHSPRGSPSRVARQTDRPPNTSSGYRAAIDQAHEGPFSAEYHHPEYFYQSGNASSYRTNLQYHGGYQHGVDQSYQNAQTYVGNPISNSLMYGQIGRAISTAAAMPITPVSASDVNIGNPRVSEQLSGTQSLHQGQYQVQSGQQPKPSVQILSGQQASLQPGYQQIHPDQQQVQQHQVQIGQQQLPQGQQHLQPAQQQIQHGQQQLQQGQQQIPQGQQLQQGQQQLPQGQQLQQGQQQLPQGQQQLQVGQQWGQQQWQNQQQTSIQPAQPIVLQHPSWMYNQQQLHATQMPIQQNQFPPTQQFQTSKGPQNQPLSGHQHTSMPFQQNNLQAQQQTRAPFPQTQQPIIGSSSFQQQQGQDNQIRQLQPAGLYPSQAPLSHGHRAPQPYHGQSMQPQQAVPPLQPAMAATPLSQSHQIPGNMTGMAAPLQPNQVSGQGSQALPVVSTAQTTPSVPIPTIPTTQASPIQKMRVSRQNSSLDDILSSSPNGVKDTIITPQVLTDQERQLQKEEAIKKQALVPALEPYSGQGALHRLLSEVEAFGKFVDELSITILGVSRLDTVWKSLLDSQDSNTKKQSMAIARCYHMKNRDPDVMPYDDTRVVMTTTKDDYINASWLNELAPSCPKFITTQAPLSQTSVEFWAMVYEQGSEVLVQITSEYETGKKFPIYFPTEKDKPVEQGPVVLTLQSVKFRQHWVERNIYLKNTQSRQGRTVVHLQFKNWQVSGFPEEVSSIVHFISEVHSFYKQQRSLTKPIIIHCGLGVGRTGVFILVYTAMQEMLHGNGLIDLPGLAKRMLTKRRGLIGKKEQLYCGYQAVLCAAEEYLEKRGILVKNPHYSAQQKSSVRASPQKQVPHIPAPDDIVLGSVDLQTIRENVGRFHISTDMASESGERPDGSMSQSDPGLDGNRTSAECISSLSNHSLPDVVQGGDTRGLSSDTQKLNPETGDSLESSDILQSKNQTFGSGNNAILGFCSDAVNPSQTVATSKDSNSSSSSLDQLQDPATFTLGTTDLKKKNKITKANFSQPKGSSLSSATDPSDPFSNLDPMWSLGKQDK